MLARAVAVVVEDWEGWLSARGKKVHAGYCAEVSAAAWCRGRPGRKASCCFMLELKSSSS